MQFLNPSRPYFWETAPFFRLLVPVIIAILLFDKGLLPSVSLFTLTSVVIGSALVGILMLIGANNRKYFPILQFSWIQLIFFFLSWLCCAYSSPISHSNWYGKSLNQAQSFLVRVAESPQQKTKTWKLPVEVLMAFDGSKVVSVSGSAFLFVYKNDSSFPIQKGDEIMIPNKWKPITNSGNPFAFDYRAFCEKNGIYHQAFLSAADISLVHQSVHTPSLIDRVHTYSMQTLEHFVTDKSTLGLMQAMLLGDEVNFDTELRQSYVDTGIIHVVAISGSHVILFFQIIATLLFFLRGRKYEAIKYLIAIPFVCLYVAVAGAPTSAIRAAIMFCLVGIGLIFRQDKQPLNLLFATAFFMLLYEPMWLFSVGFQLSFLAVLSLILFYKKLSRLVVAPNVYLQKLWEAASASLAAEILIAPLVIYYFHTFPLTFLIANILAYLCMGVVLIGSMLIIFLSYFSSIAGLMAIILTFLVKVFNSTIVFLQSLNPKAFSNLFLSFPSLLCVYGFVIGMSLFWLQNRRKGLTIAISATAILLMLMTVNRWNSIHQPQFVVYNINRNSYAEFLSNGYYFPLLNNGSIKPEIDFATKENHIATGNWKSGKSILGNVFRFQGKKILILDRAIQFDTASFAQFDIVVIAFPVKRFEGETLQKIFRFNQLVVTGSQKRNIMEQWKANCQTLQIPAHFTLLDGAFVFK
ncbi:MAG: ComEC family competence protein [Bacteroidetes bacterium]|nr:ComEC family competence protein [Bacteroidota bacterium]